MGHFTRSCLLLAALLVLARVPSLPALGAAAASAVPSPNIYSTGPAANQNQGGRQTPSAALGAVAAPPVPSPNIHSTGPAAGNATTGGSQSTGGRQVPSGGGSTTDGVPSNPPSTFPNFGDLLPQPGGRGGGAVDSVPYVPPSTVIGNPPRGLQLNIDRTRIESNQERETISGSARGAGVTVSVDGSTARVGTGGRFSLPAAMPPPGASRTAIVQASDASGQTATRRVTLVRPVPPPAPAAAPPRVAQPVASAPPARPPVPRSKPQPAETTVAQNTPIATPVTPRPLARPPTPPPPPPPHPSWIKEVIEVTTPVAISAAGITGVAALAWALPFLLIGRWPPWQPLPPVPRVRGRKGTAGVPQVRSRFHLDLALRAGVQKSGSGNVQLRVGAL